VQFFFFVLSAKRERLVFVVLIWRDTFRIYSTPEYHIGYDTILLELYITVVFGVTYIIRSTKHACISRQLGFMCHIQLAGCRLCKTHCIAKLSISHIPVRRHKKKSCTYISRRGLQVAKKDTCMNNILVIVVPTTIFTI
jgi:hypothetical protein